MGGEASFVMPPEVLQHTARWMSFLRADWHDDIPDRIHKHEYADDGTYQWDPRFEAWLTGVRGRDERQFRMKRAMRKLREKSVREYEVAYRMIVVGEPLSDTTRWLNERAVRNEKPERYSEQDTRVIIASAVDKLLAWF